MKATRYFNRLSIVAFDLLYRLQRPASQSRFCIVLGHMRCGSSLLVHLLDNHPQISSAGELHRSYLTTSDLQKMPAFAGRLLRRIRPRELTVDKVLHGYLKVSGDVMADPRCHMLLMAREPIESISSMAKTFPDWFGKNPSSQGELIKLAADHWSSRISDLRSYVQQIAAAERPLLAFTYRGLLAETGRLFQRIETVLGLTSPLTESYATNATTGVFGRGDISGNIGKKKIDRRIERTPVELPESLRSALLDEWSQFLAILRETPQVDLVDSEDNLVTNDPTG
jgi:hypothetical protein